MTRGITRRGATMAIAALCALGALGCSGSSNSATGVDAGTTLPAAAAAATTTTSPKAVCDEKSLLPVLQAKFPGATLAHLACDTKDAAATIVGVAELSPDGVGLFSAKKAVWTLEASAPVGADPKSFVPEGFPMTTYNVWKSKYDADKNPAAPRAPRAPTSESGRKRCEGQADTNCDPKATTTTEFEFPTTTIPITLPPTTPPPEVTTVPTTGTPGGGGISPFCTANPFDPRCLANPSFPG